MKALCLFITLILFSAPGRTFCQENSKVPTDMYKHAQESYDRQDFTHALDYFIKTMRTTESEDSTGIFISSVGYIANIYSIFGDINNNIYYLEKGYKASLKTNNTELQGSFLINLVAGYCKAGDVASAKKYFSILQRTPLINDKSIWEYYVMYDEARIYNAEKKYTKAIDTHTKALQFARIKNLGAPKEMFQENEIANIYVNTGKYQNSLIWGHLCKDRALKENDKELLANSYKVLYNSYRGLGDSVNATTYYNLYNSTKDSIFNVSMFYESSYKLKQYETDLIESSVSQFKIRAITIYIITAIIIVFIVIGFWRKHKSKSSLKNKKNETAALSDELTEDIFEKINILMNDRDKITCPDFSLSVLADEIHSNTKYVSWVINKRYGQNFKSLLNEKRIEEAIKMLSDDNISKNYTIQSVYEEVGYTNATSFIRAFKRITGSTPAEYRDKANKH